MSDPITEIEIKLTLAEDLLEQLNLTVFRQQQQIDLLQRQVRQLQEQLQQMQATLPGEPRSPRDEIPPHY